MHPLDTDVQTGRVRFARGDFLAAHEAWEAGWRSGQGPERELLQALAQLAAAFLQWQRGKSVGAATLFGRARGHLGALPSTLLGVEVSELELQLSRWEEAAARGERPPAAPRLQEAEAPGPASAQGERVRCPYCGERVRVQAEWLGVPEERYVEDCPVCCRPWSVHVTRDGNAVAVRLGREDD